MLFRQISGGWRAAAVGVLAIVTAALSSLASAAALPTGADLEAAGWQTVTFPGIKASRFVGKGDGGIELVAESSSALLLRPLTADNAGAQKLRWRWRVEQAPAAGDLASKGADDRPLAVHVWFPRPEGERGFWSQFADGIKSAILGAPLSGRVLTYVWGGRQGRGAKLVNPHTGPDGVMIVLRPGDTEIGQWFEEEVDIAADFAMAFGRPAPTPSHIALSADSDDLGGRSVGHIHGLMFSP